jgi:hypothetical protein
MQIIGLTREAATPGRKKPSSEEARAQALSLRYIADAPFVNFAATARFPPAIDNTDAANRLCRNPFPRGICSNSITALKNRRRPPSAGDRMPT